MMRFVSQMSSLKNNIFKKVEIKTIILNYTIITPNTEPHYTTKLNIHDLDRIQTQGSITYAQCMLLKKNKLSIVCYLFALEVFLVFKTNKPPKITSE